MLYMSGHLAVRAPEDSRTRPPAPPVRAEWKSAQTPTNHGSDAMIRRRLGQALMVIALASAAVSTAPVHAQEPSSITTPGTVTAATSLPHSFWIPRRSTRRRLAGHLVGSRHCRYFRPVRSHRDRDRRQSIPHELALAGLRDRRDRLRGTRHAGNPRVPGRTVGGAQRDRHGACRACGRPWRYWLARWDG